ncbi:MAG TPA: GntR family transcriptional regulator [Candidatus Nitrosotalea sp.]|nr:GntR family transcriptional regulator [Candidatus Nitrosotalea sp.]
MEATTLDSQDGLKQIMRRSAVHYTTVGDLTYSVLRQAILSGVLKPGQQLRQDALADSLGVSRLPVRSALLQLASDGLIVMRAHRGAIVSTLSGTQIKQIYEARRVLETYALRQAIANMTPERLAALETLADQLDATESGEEFVEARFAFYDKLYGTDGNPVISSLIERLRNDVGRYWLRRRVAHGHEPEHSRLLGYVRRRDADGATRWLEGHIRQVAEELAALAENPTAVAAGGL